MPLWFHPVPVPVDLGAPVYPSPLFYHPPPYLVDPRPVNSHDTLYCTCQFSYAPAHFSPHLQVPLAPSAPQGTSIPRRIAATRLRKVRDLEWEYESSPRTETRVEEQTGRSVTISIRHNGPTRNPVPPPLCHESAEQVAAAGPRLHSRECRAVSNPELGRRGAGLDMEGIRAEIYAEILAQKEVARMRAEVRAELKREIEAENRAAVENLARREREVEKREDEVRGKEQAWIGAYGAGIVGGDGAVHSPPPSLCTHPVQRPPCPGPGSTPHHMRMPGAYQPHIPACTPPLPPPPPPPPPPIVHTPPISEHSLHDPEPTYIPDEPARTGDFYAQDGGCELRITISRSASTSSGDGDVDGVVVREVEGQERGVEREGKRVRWEGVVGASGFEVGGHGMGAREGGSL